MHDHGNCERCDTQETRLANLCTALSLLLADVRRVACDEPSERCIPCQHRVDDLHQAHRALVEGRDE